jgi:hypothetical protein
MEAVETFTHEGVTVELHYDDDAGSTPRDWDNVSVLAGWDDRIEVDEEIRFDFPNPKAFETHMREEHGAVGPILPLFLLDHSGLRIRTGDDIANITAAGRFIGDGAGWDTSFVGVVYATKETLEMTGVAEKDIKVALEQDIATLDQFFMGDVYGYVIKDEDDNVTDSCWGFYGLDDVRDEAKNMAECEAQRQSREHDEATYWAARGVETVA